MEDARLLLRRYEGNQRIDEVRAAASPSCVLESGGWRLRADSRHEGEPWRWTWTVESLGEGRIAVGIARRFPVAADCHLSIPAAVYDGNRFRALPLVYPCILREPKDLRPNLPTTISQVPRLPFLQLLAGDASLPAVGVLERSKRSGVWWITGQESAWGQTGIEAIEDPDGLQVAFLYPGVREGRVYNGTPEWRESPDLGAMPEVRETIEFDVHERRFEGENPEHLYSALFDIRSTPFHPEPKHEIPFYEAGRLIEAKHNDRYWNEAEGYYMLSDGTWEYGQWQAGWVGGGIQMAGLAVSDDPLTQARVRRMLDFVAGPAQSDSGLYWSVSIDGKMDTDMVGMDYGHDWHLVRRSGDVLYFLLATLDVLEGRGEPLRENWLESARRAADALQTIWKDNSRLGMFVSQDTLEIRSGDTTSGAIVPAALVRAHRRWPGADFLESARGLARYYVERYLDRGYTNGGPGEAAQCPDSESAFGLLESLVELYEATSDPFWLRKAWAAANLAASWVMPYDFRFPPDSTLGRANARTTGSVWANIQNKHSAPGICTLSGVSLLKLYRWTNDRRYLELLRDIAHCVVQYLSREDRPLFGLPPGASCERVNTSDWEAPDRGVGEGFAVDCWCSISALLTWAELPGVYLRTDTGEVVVLDHLEVVSARTELTLRNPTRFHASVRVLAETESDSKQPLGSMFAHRLPRLEIPPGGTRTFKLGH
jgi:hypothetical protein